MREGLRLALLRSPHIRVVGEAADGETAVALAERRRPDVVIMDLRMPQMDGIEATEEIMQRVPDARVLVFTAYSERALLQRGLESGAAGYILKEAPHETLLQGDREGRRRRDVRRPGADPVARDRPRRARRSSPSASARSCSCSPTACRTPTSRRSSSSRQETVKSHVRHILAKLEAETRTQAVAIALREAMID